MCVQLNMFFKPLNPGFVIACQCEQTMERTEHSVNELVSQQVCYDEAINIMFDQSVNPLVLTALNDFGGCDSVIICAKDFRHRFLLFSTHVVCQSNTVSGFNHCMCRTHIFIFSQDTVAGDKLNSTPLV